MATLTLDPKKLTASEKLHTDRYIRDKWRMMRVLLAREYGSGGKSLDFVGVLEFQKNGNAHLHILLGRYIPQEWVAKAWQSSGGGEDMEICFVEVHRGSAYFWWYLGGDKD